jgi:uncharacterized membrane protein
MAGIGWKLQGMIDRGSLASTAGAYLTGAAVTSAPWLLTTAVLTSLRLLSRSEGAPAFAGIERIVTLIYAVTIISSAPVHVVVSRYAADRLYDHRLERIAAPLWRALALIVAGSGVLGAGLMLLLRVPLALGVAGTVLTAIIGGQWLLLSVCGGMVSPPALLRAFAVGAPLGIGAALLFERRFVGGDVGYLLGFAVGQLATLALLLRATVWALPREVAEDARLAPAFAEYYLLALAAFTYHLAIWADKLMVWLVAGKRVAALYASMAALAWFSTIPAFGWIYVQIETTFYRNFRRFYDDLEGGAPLGRLREGATRVCTESYRIMRGAAAIQATVTLVVLVAAPSVIRAAALPAVALGPFRLAVLGAALQVLALLAILFLYYFDLRREALAVSLALLVGEAVFVGATALTGWSPATGYPLACAGAALLGLMLVRRRLRTLLADTFQSQPSGSAT